MVKSAPKLAISFLLLSTPSQGPALFDQPHFKNEGAQTEEFRQSIQPPLYTVEACPRDHCERLYNISTRAHSLPKVRDFKKNSI